MIEDNSNPAKVEIWDMHEPYEENNVVVLGKDNSFNLEETEKTNEQIERDVDLVWNKTKGTANPLVNLVAYEKEAGVFGNHYIFLEANKGSFKYHIVLNKLDNIPEELEGKTKSSISDFRKYAVDNNHLVLTAMALLYTKDGKAVFTEKKKGITTGTYSVIPAGYVDPLKDTDTFGVPSINSTIGREFNEELGVSNDYISELYNTGILFSDGKNRGFSLTYLMKTELTFDELNKKYYEKHDDETKMILGVGFNQKEISDFLKDYLMGFTNNGLGCLLVSGRVVLGAEWYRKTKDSIRENYGRISNLTPMLGNVKELLKERRY